MIKIKVECDTNIQQSIRECLELVEKFMIGTTMEVNGIVVDCMPWDTFDSIYADYLEYLKELDS